VFLAAAVLTGCSNAAGGNDGKKLTPEQQMLGEKLAAVGTANQAAFNKLHELSMKASGAGGFEQSDIESAIKLVAAIEPKVADLKTKATESESIIMTRVRTVGQETIDQQSDAFKKALMIKLEDYINLSEKDLLDTAESKDLADIIKSFTGMSVHVQFSKLATHMVPLDVKANNILINKAVRKWFTNSVGMAAINAGKGTTSILVDLEKGKITGALTEYRFTLNIGTEVMNGKFTTGELAAIILHEVGHAFTYLEYIVRAITTNQVMEGVAKELAGTNDIKKREAILVSAKQALRLKDLDAASLAACEDNKVVEYTLISSTITEPDSQSGSSIYDENSFEMLADQYAARNGAGRDLVTALDKLHKSRQVKYISYRSTGEYLFVEALKVVMIVVGMVLLELAVFILAVSFVLCFV